MFEKSNLRRSMSTFSFYTAYKQVSISTVGEEDTPVTAVSVSFSLPFLQLRRGDLAVVRQVRLKHVRESLDPALERPPLPHLICSG